MQIRPSGPDGLTQIERTFLTCHPDDVAPSAERLVSHLNLLLEIWRAILDQMQGSHEAEKERDGGVSAPEREKEKGKEKEKRREREEKRSDMISHSEAVCLSSLFHLFPFSRFFLVHIQNAIDRESRQLG